MYKAQSSPLPLGEPEETVRHGDMSGFKNSVRMSNSVLSPNNIDAEIIYVVDMN